MSVTQMTRSEKMASDLAALFRAGNSLIWLVTREESRVEKYVFEAAASAKFQTLYWDIGSGVCEYSGAPLTSLGSTEDPEAVLAAIRGRAVSGDRTVWVLRDLPVWLAGPPMARTLRLVRNLAKSLPQGSRQSAQAMVVITPSSEVPPELAGHVTLIDWPLPDRSEIAAILDARIEALPEEMRATAAPNGTREQAIDAAIGLTGEEAYACYGRSLVQHRRIDPVTVAGEKKRVIAKEGLIEWFDPLPGGLSAVGGLEGLKAWLIARSMAYSPQAREYGLPAPKGCMLIGVPGCGKSLTAKAIATNWGVPLLRVDLGALKGKYVGQSESNLRRVFALIESVGRCVVWLDEIEKSLAGATQGAADGGVSADALGAILSWMQDRKGESFVVATANKVEELPPELLRKGRFDEVFFVDLPTATERVAVLEASLRSHGRGKVAIDAKTVAAACDGFTGSEIAELVPDAMFAAFGDGAREISTADLVSAAGSVVPLSTTAAEKIEALRKWAQGRARSASVAEVAKAAKPVRAIDI